MNINEVGFKLNQDPNIPPGTKFLTNMEGHLILIEVVKNRASMMETVHPDVEPVVVGPQESLPIEEPQQIEKEPLPNGEGSNNIEPAQVGGSDVPEMRVVEGTE